MTNASELLSSTACPSLSPSPSPYPPSVKSEQDFDFCDPRNLTVSPSQSTNSTVTIGFPTLPTLCTGDDEEHRFMLGGETFAKAAVEHNTFDFNSTIHHGLPTFDEFSDLDSEDEFVNGLVNFPATDNVQTRGNVQTLTSLSRTCCLSTATTSSLRTNSKILKTLNSSLLHVCQVHQLQPLRMR